MVVNTLKISFCADHSWCGGGSQGKMVAGRKMGGGNEGGGGRKEIKKSTLHMKTLAFVFLPPDILWPDREKELHYQTIKRPHNL